MLRILKNEMNINKYRAKFIKEIAIDKTFVISNRKKVEILKELKKKNYPTLHRDLNAVDREDDEEDQESDDEDEKIDAGIEKKKQPEKKILYKSYDYLTDIKLFSLTYEKMKKINEEYQQKKEEYEYYENITEKELWLKELKEFKKEYENWIEDRKKTAKKNDNIKLDKRGKKLKPSKDKK